MGVLFSMRHRGAGGLAARAGSIVSRFGLTADPMERRLRFFDELTGEFGVRPTWAITARILARNAEACRRFSERGVELAVHGLVHDDHSLRSLDEQRESIGRAAALFEAAGVPFTGFRGPFLRGNEATDQAVRELGFVYHSTTPVVFDTVAPALGDDAEAAYRRALRHLYSARTAERVLVRPRVVDGVVHLPVALPDDEILVDRLRMDARAMADTWSATLDATWRRGELFTLQLHPERIYECAPALRALLAEARSRRPAVWIAPLQKIAAWWRRRGQTRLAVESDGCGAHRVRLDGDPEATLLVRNHPEVDSLPWHGADRVARGRRFELRGARKPVVGVSPRTPASVLALLAEEGYPVQRGDDPAHFGAWVDAPGSWDERMVLDAVEAAPGPLVRLARWPAGARSALAVTGDIDCMTLQDFALRLWETRR